MYADDIKKGTPPWDFRGFIQNKYAVEESNYIYSIWNTYRQLYLYQCLSTVKKKKYRQRQEIFQRIIG
jgi:hypothetical protein